MTKHSGAIDLLGLNSASEIVLVELKRERTPRDVVAQALDYASWARRLGLDDLRDIWSEYRHGETSSLDDAFSDRFPARRLEDPDGAHRLIIVASELDNSTERIVDYLNDEWAVPINAALFGCFTDGGSEYLVRTWLREPNEREVRQRSRSDKPQSPWDGRTWAVNFGDNGSSRAWEDGRRYGYVSAGGGDWYVRTLKNLEPGHVVACIVPGAGYVAVGEVVDTARRIDEATVEVNGRVIPVLELKLQATDAGRALDDPDRSQAEHVVAVRWTDARPRTEAVWERDMYANQNTVTKLRDQVTLDRLRQNFRWPAHD